MHQAAGLGLQEASDPLGRCLTTVPALDLQALNSAGAAEAKNGHGFENLDTLPCLAHVRKAAPNCLSYIMRRHSFTRPPPV